MSETHSSDVAVVGAGLIGLSCALAIAERGTTVLLVGYDSPGAASAAAAGLLAPSVERGEGPAHRFAIAARDRYPGFLAWLADRTGHTVPLNREGVLQIAVSEAGVKGLRRAMPEGAGWLDAAALARLEPALAHGRGAVHHPVDGAIDNVELLGVLAGCARLHPRIRRLEAQVVSIRFGAGVALATRAGETVRAGRVVLAAGAWSPDLRGLPRPLPVEPVRGEMVEYAVAPFRHAVYGPTGYAVPRPDGRVVIGSTMDRVGFDHSTTDAGRRRILAAAAEICPRLRDVTPTAHWAGLRPITPDMQPILGADPDEPALLYACGHSRNGVLMTPLTGDCVAALVHGEAPPLDLAPFAIARFSRPDGTSFA